MIKNIIFYSIILFPIESFGQFDVLLNAQLNQSYSKSEIISKGRRLIIEEFSDSDLEAVQELKDYLVTEVENEDYAAFYPIEYWLILYWTREYRDLLSSINGTDSVTVAVFLRKRKPQYDMLTETLQDKSRNSRLQLESYIRSAGLDSIEKDFLLLHLKHITTEPDYQKITRDTVNKMAEDFLSKYPASEYDYFVRKYIRDKYVPARWSVAVELFSGYGVFTENLGHTYEHNIPIGAALDVNFKKFSLYLRDYIGRSKTKSDIPYDSGIWEKGSEVEVLLAEASLGYMIIESKLFKITPFAGIGATHIGPIFFDLDKDPELEKVALKFTTTFSVGLNADLKLGQSRDAMLAQKTKQRYWFIRFRYAYNMPQFEKKYEDFNGNMHYLTVGIGRFFRKIKRVY